MHHLVNSSFLYEEIDVWEAHRWERWLHHGFVGGCISEHGWWICLVILLMIHYGFQFLKWKIKKSKHMITTDYTSRLVRIFIYLLYFQCMFIFRAKGNRPLTDLRTTFHIVLQNHFTFPWILWFFYILACQSLCISVYQPKGVFLLLLFLIDWEFKPTSNIFV